MKNDLYNKVVLLQNCLIDCATGKDYNNNDYEDTRKILLADSKLKKHLPEFISTCRTPAQFWPFIRKKYLTYSERREFIWNWSLS